VLFFDARGEGRLVAALCARALAPDMLRHCAAALGLFRRDVRNGGGGRRPSGRRCCCSIGRTRPLRFRAVADEIAVHASARATIMAGSISQTASQKAISLGGSGLAMEEIAGACVGTSTVETRSERDPRLIRRLRDIAASLLIVCPYASGLESRERGGRTRPRNSESQRNLTMNCLLPVCASHSKFQPITRDLGSCRIMPSFALSRWQREFESRWGYKIKPP
jgi:hypothetical protein